MISQAQLKKKNLDLLNLILPCITIMIIQGCTLASKMDKGSEVQHPSQANSLYMARVQREEGTPPKRAQRVIGKDPHVSMNIAPKFKTLSPLDFQKVTISFVDEDYRVVLQALAHAAGLNLIIDSDAEEQMNRGMTLTAEFQERPLRAVLDYVCKAMDLTWNEKDGTIFIHGYKKSLIDLDFLNPIQESKFNVGGDVLGGSSTSGGGGGGNGESEVLTPLKGNFELSGGKNAEDTDIYKEIEEVVADHVGDDGKFFLNRSTGTLMVIARPHVVEDIEKYIHHVREKYRRQVLIEAKILEVSLDNSYSLGIDWRFIEGTFSKTPLQPRGATFNLESWLTNDNSVVYKINIANKYYDITTLVHALEQYGQVKTLSNPRLKVLNGQSALISVGKSVSYLKSFEIETTVSEGGHINNPTVELSSIFDGVLLGVTPEIDESGMVNLHLVPIESNIISMEEKEFQGGNRYTFPVVNLREASTVVRVRSGELVILGGLIQDRNYTNNGGVPILDNLPLVGDVFKYKQRRRQRVELVIILLIRVINP